MSPVKKPWGNYTVLHCEPGFQVKRVELLPGLRLSLQKHAKRSEKWVVVSGKALVTVGETHKTAEKGSFIDIPCDQLHRIQNSGKEPLIFIEVQLGDYLGEDDIVRIEDDFGRA